VVGCWATGAPPQAARTKQNSASRVSLRANIDHSFSHRTLSVMSMAPAQVAAAREPPTSVQKLLHAKYGG
jgi:hypothetical protein